MISLAIASALRMVDRLDACLAMTGDSIEAEDLDIDGRIAGGDKLVAYDVITAAIDELDGCRERLAETLLGNEAMLRLAALAAEKGARRC